VRSRTPPTRIYNTVPKFKLAVLSQCKFTQGHRQIQARTPTPTRTNLVLRPQWGPCLRVVGRCQRLRGNGRHESHTQCCTHCLTCGVTHVLLACIAEAQDRTAPCMLVCVIQGITASCMLVCVIQGITASCMLVCVACNAWTGHRVASFTYMRSMHWKG